MESRSKTREKILDEIQELSLRLKSLENNSSVTPVNSNKTFSGGKYGKKPYLDIFIKLIPTLAFISFLAMLIMAFYEVAKQSLIPQISILASHIITIGFSGLVAPVAAYYVLRKFEMLRREVERENQYKLISEKELQRYKDELELRVKERTSQLHSTNQRLRDEIELHKKTGNALLNIEKRYKHLFKKSPVGIFKYDHDFYITEFNDKFVELVDLEPAEIKKINLLHLSDKRVMPALKGALKGEEVNYEGAFRILENSNEYLISIKVAPHYDESQEISGGIAIVENISERKKTEDNLLKAKEEAERSNNLKSEFLASMSHEIRTPINTILSFNSLIKEEVQDFVNEDLAISFDHMEKAGKRIIRTIDLILNMSELQTNTFDYQPRMLDLFGDILKNVFHDYRKEAIVKGLDFRLLNEITDTKITCDEYSLKQIFGNLVDNAIKYTTEGFVEIRITTFEGKLTVEIEDSGIGISNDYKKQLFTPFSQEEQGYTRRFEGNGLGLALVKEYVDINNLEISFTSSKNEGSTFRVLFPNNMKI